MQKIIDLINKNELTKALSRLKSLIKKDKKNGELYYFSALIYQKNDDLKNSKIYYEKAISFKYQNDEMYKNLSTIYHKLNEDDNLIKCLKIINKKENSWEIYSNIGNILKKQKKYDEALENYNSALKINPNNPIILFNIGNLFMELSNFDNALEYYQKALEKDKNNENIKIQIINIYEKQDNLKKALELCENLINDNPNSVLANKKLASIHADLLNSNKAIYYYKKAITLEPNNKQLYFELSLIYLRLKDFNEGWDLYFQREFTLNIPSNNKKIFNFYNRLLKTKKYKGENLKGKTLFIYSEQGFGDTIMFAPFIKKLSKESNILFSVNSSLVKIIEDSLELDNLQVIEKFTKLNVTFDYQIRLIDLVALYVKKEEDCKIEPYLKTKNSSQLDNNKIKIGISFKGNPKHLNDKNRSIELSDFTRFLTFDEKITYYSLEKDLNSKQKELLKKYNIENIGESFNNFYDTASTINELDLVVCVDTAVAHVSASIGKKTLILLPFAPDWRWGTKEKGSHWYKNHVQLIRQEKPNSWDMPKNETIECINSIIKEY